MTERTFSIAGARGSVKSSVRLVRSTREAGPVPHREMFAKFEYRYGYGDCVVDAGTAEITGRYALVLETRAPEKPV